MASYDTLQKLAGHPDWIPPRSDLRVFLGEPGAPEATKTTVEPGNAFSPGMRSFGVTWWLRDPGSGEFFAAELQPLESLRWGYAEGYLPLLHCETEFNRLAIRHSLFQDGNAQERSEAVCARLQVTNRGAAPSSLQVFIVLRSLGPAGGPLHDLKLGADGCSFWLAKRSLPLLTFDKPPSASGCGVGDPSPLARQGNVPGEAGVEDGDGWCYGLARFDLALAPAETWEVCFDCPQQTVGSLQAETPSTAVPRPGEFAARAERHLAGWRDRLGSIDLQVPDEDFRNAFFAGLQHMLIAVVGDQARIACLSYPLPWLRDSVFIMRCFDLAGWHSFARAATEYCARNDFYGGFGAEGDAPGEGIWALVEHYRITRDQDWLRSVYPAIQRKCAWLWRMRRTAAPIQVTTDTPVLAFTHAMRSSGVICLPGAEGIIMGSMDHGVEYALGWVNHWAVAGWREAAYAARELGETVDAQRYEVEGDDLFTALKAYAEKHPAFFSHERTVNSLLHPTRAWAGDIDAARAYFLAWWQKNRLKDGIFQPEPYWLYFEAAQAHNALLMGEREIAWQVLRWRLHNQDLPGLYGWREGGNGVGTENAVHGVTLINQLRGCQSYESITPHGWSQAEMWLLQRAVLVEEMDGIGGDDGGLLLFAGVPDEWLKPGAHIAFRDFPTACGKVSAALQVSDDGRSASVNVSGAREGTPVRVKLKGQEHVIQNEKELLLWKKN